MDCVRRLCDAMDTTFNEKIELEEMKLYVSKHRAQLPFSDEVLQLMFTDAASGRGFVSEEQVKGPLSHEEISAAVRGRHYWDAKTKQWGIKYRAYRDYWIAMLLTVNPKIFAQPVPKIIPQRIKAQYELEDEQKQSTFARTKAP